MAGLPDDTLDLDNVDKTMDLLIFSLWQRVKLAISNNGTDTMILMYQPSALLE